MKTNQSTSWGRRCWSKQERQELLAGFERAGVTATEFARQHDINPKTFSRWVREAREPKKEVITFQQVEAVIPQVCGDGRLEILLPNHFRVLISVGSVQEVAAVLKEVAQC